MDKNPISNSTKFAFFHKKTIYMFYPKHYVKGRRIAATAHGKKKGKEKKIKRVTPHKHSPEQ